MREWTIILYAALLAATALCFKQVYTRLEEVDRQTQILYQNQMLVAEQVKALSIIEVQRQQAHDIF